MELLPAVRQSEAYSSVRPAQLWAIPAIEAKIVYSHPPQPSLSPGRLQVGSPHRRIRGIGMSGDNKCVPKASSTCSDGRENLRIPSSQRSRLQFVLCGRLLHHFGSLYADILREHDESAQYPRLTAIAADLIICTVQRSKRGNVVLYVSTGAQVVCVITEMRYLSSSLSILNAASLLGRLIPNLFADKLGPSKWVVAD